MPDLRRSERAKTGGAKIIFNNRMSTMDFIVKNISSSGAKLAQPCSAADPQFVLARIDLAPQSNWELHAEHETWVLVLEGCANIEVGASQWTLEGFKLGRGDQCDGHKTLTSPPPVQTSKIETLHGAVSSA
jgi:hypothetical protein